tara:strand:+ start:1767 stop:2429 length:663 start_codon:yes stop_codon:yes gene_type:complete
MSSNNNSWTRGAKVSNDYKDSFSRKKEKKKNSDVVLKEKKEKYHKHDDDIIPIKKEFNLFDHPEMKPNESFYENNEKISYLEKCKIQKEEDIESKNTLPPGWIAMKGEKGSREIKVSRNNIHYYDTINDTYTEYELENLHLQEEYENRMNLENVLDNIYLKRLNESIIYFKLTNEKNVFLNELEIQQEIDIKLDELDEEFVNQSDSEEDSESDYYDSDEN